MKKILIVALLCLPLGAVEIATGRMLGSGYDSRAFYMRNGNEAWRKTYTGSEFRPEAAGRLMNLRIGQAIVHDEWLTEEKFDPEANTDRVIAALDVYKRHGIIAISTSLQGANPAYELTNNIKRDRAYSLGQGKGMLMSAFRPDGSLKPQWMARTLRLARALNNRGMVLHLIYFYAHQDEVLADPAAIRQAAVNATDWLIDNKLRNVIIEVANELDVKTFNHDLYIRKNLVELMRLIRSRFDEKKAGFRLPVSTSTTGGSSNMAVFPEIREHGDLILLHGNNRTADQKGKRTAELMKDPGAPLPVVFSEDNNGRETDAPTLVKELASLNAIFDAGGSWGYMPWRAAQIWPFRAYDPFRYAKAEGEYFRRVLQSIQSRVYATPPNAAKLRLIIDEDFTKGKSNGVQLQNKGEFTPDGWKVTTKQTQLRYDLGKPHARGVVEVVVRGPLRMQGKEQKRFAVSIWNDAKATDGDRKSQSFYQLRFQEQGMMLRLTNRSGGKSFEGQTPPLEWDENKWYTIRGEWNAEKGENHLWRNGELLKSGSFNDRFPGLRWMFLGKDNYKPGYESVPGVVYRSVKVWVGE